MPTTISIPKKLARALMLMQNTKTFNHNLLMNIGVLLMTIGVSSCRTQYVVMPSSHTRDSTHFALHRDSTYVYEKDSISFSFTEIPTLGGQPQSGYSSNQYEPRRNSKGAGGDLCDLGRSVSEGLHTEGCVKSASAPYPPAAAWLPTIHHWHTRYRDRVVTTTDTITVTQHDSIPYPVEVPMEVEKPIPRFYVNCTIAFWIVLLLLVLLLAAKIYYRLHHP